MADNRPVGRQRNVSGQGKGVSRRGSGVGGGPAGHQGGYSGRPTSSGRSGGYSSGSTGGFSGGTGSTGGGGYRSSGGGLLSNLGGKKGIIIVVAIIIIAVLIFGGKGIIGKLGSLFGNVTNLTNLIPNLDTSYVSTLTQAGSSSGWERSSNLGVLNKNVVSGAREKYTTIKGNGKDKVTMMVYMCGTDLESKSGMASSDLAEMAKATLTDDLDIIVYTGGCTEWKTTGISNSKNQIYKVTSTGLKRLEDNMGNKSMTDPATLSEFIKYCAKNYTANRYELIFWDHGGGSVSGFGYDQRFPKSGSMSLTGINTALKNGGVKFDFIGFDACLMASAETALMLSQYGDYMIASEETEPGVGWYYTNWVSAFSADPSMSTLELGKMIIDEYTSFCAEKYGSAKTTLSLVDLAELSSTLPGLLGSFGSSTSNLIKSDSYQEVSAARSATREFSTSKIDQVDLVNLADNMGTAEGKALADAVLSAVKYNKVSSSMTNSYGLSIYFPYQKLSNVDKAVVTYDAIGIDSEYANCIKDFASMEVAGQVTSGGSTSPLSSLMGNLISGNSGSSSSTLTSILSGFLGGTSARSIDGLDSGNSSFLSNLDAGKAGNYLSGKLFDASKLTWQDYNGSKVIHLTEDQWSLVQSIELNLFIDDGKGYIDMGLDNIFEFNDDGMLIGEYDGAWLAINDQPIAYYHTGTVLDGSSRTITGRVPVLLNGDRAELIIVFDDDHPSGYVQGYRYTYDPSVTETVAKDAEELQEGDKIDFLCDYYSYDGTYQDSYMIGDQLTVSGELRVSDVLLSDEKVNATYMFVDVYNQEYWTEVIE